MIKELKQQDLLKIVASNPVKNGSEYNKIVVRPILLKNEECFQAEQYKNSQIFHRNIPSDELSNWVEENVECKFRQILISLQDKDVTYLLSAKGKVRELKKRRHQKS